MKRNILLLTAVVLAAVMLTGCSLPFFGGKVEVEYKYVNDEVKAKFVQTGLVTKVKKNSIVDIKLALVEAESVETATYKVTAKSGEFTYTIGRTDDKKAYAAKIPVLKDKVEVTVALP